MKTISSLLSDQWYERYQQISKLNVRSSIYDITNACNLACKDCFYFSSTDLTGEETQLDNWNSFIEKEVNRGVNLAILIGGEPTLHPERLEAFYKQVKTLCATNGLIPIPRDRFPEMTIAISTWGAEESETRLRGMDTFSVSSRNYKDDPRAYFIYSLSPAQQKSDIESMILKVKKAGLKVHIQLLCSHQTSDHYCWNEEKLQQIRIVLDEMLDTYPETFISTKYYHRVLTSRKMLSRTFGWSECPSVSQPLDKRDPAPRALPGFVRWAPDLETVRKCCVSRVRNCNVCNDGAAIMSWIMVNKRAHVVSGETMRNWVKVVEMFAKLNGLMAW